MAAILSFRDLEVWQVSMDLVAHVYLATDGFPGAERFGLTAQVRRAVVSILANIAEGHARRADAVYLNHVRIALGSQAELTTEIEVAMRLGFITPSAAAAVFRDIDRVRQMLHGLRRSLGRRRKASLGAAALGVIVCALAPFFQVALVY